jgi:beta-lactamase regulating signal transducer with metallopeptidase domain
VTLVELQSLAQIMTERLLNSAAEGIVVAALVCVCLRLLGRQNSGTRFAIWFSALLSIVALPLSGGFLAASHPPGLASGNTHGEITLSTSWAFYLFDAWLMGASLLLLRLSIGLWRVCQIRRHCSQVDLAAIDPAIRCIVQDDMSRRVRLCVSSEVAVPAAIGFFRPAIVFPASLFSQLSADEVKVIVLHELAHLRRWDDWTNLAQKIVKAVFFFHPAVWWIENRLTLEREMACDDIVLAQASSPRAYASSLISLAEKLHSTRALALAQALLSRMNQMSRRVTQILDAKRPKTIGVAKPALALSAALLVLALCASPSMPGIVTFNASQNQTSANAGKLAVNRTNLGEATGGSLSSHASHAQVIPASFNPAMFNPRAAIVRRQLKGTSARKPAVLLAKTKTAQENRFARETFVILQTTEYDPAGSAVWTLCVWRVGNTPAERKLESAIVISSI